MAWREKKERNYFKRRGRGYESTHSSTRCELLVLGNKRR
jgi:hypothetical protein